MRHNESDKSDWAAESCDCRRQDRTEEVCSVFDAAYGDSARGRPFLSRHKRIELATDPKQANETYDHKRGRVQNRTHIRRIYCAHHPSAHQIALTEVCSIVN